MIIHWVHGMGYMYGIYAHIDEELVFFLTGLINRGVVFASEAFWADV